MRHQDVVDASQLGVDLEAQVGEGLRGGLHYILYLHTLGCHAKECITHPLYLSCKQKREKTKINHKITHFIHTYVTLFLCSILTKL